MVRKIINNTSSDDISRTEVESNDTETEEVKQEESKDKVYIQHICIPIEQMFNIINDKLDFILKELASPIKES